jgi:hypothetical protein
MIYSSVRPYIPSPMRHFERSSFAALITLVIFIQVIVGEPSLLQHGEVSWLYGAVAPHNLAHHLLIVSMWGS